MMALDQRSGAQQTSSSEDLNFWNKISQQMVSVWAQVVNRLINTAFQAKILGSEAYYKMWQVHEKNLNFTICMYGYCN